MSWFARVDNGTVVELIDVPEGQEIADLFHPDFVATCFPCGDDVATGWSYDGTSISAPPAPGLDARKADMLAQIDGKIATILRIGAPAGGLHIALDDSSRADMGSMATTALAAISGAAPWPDSYKQGWISIENTRIPLVAPNDGLTLAAGVGDYYAKVRQNGRTLKDAVAAAAKQADLDAINVDGGWPG